MGRLSLLERAFGGFLLLFALPHTFPSFRLFVTSITKRVPTICKGSAQYASPTTLLPHGMLVVHSNKHKVFETLSSPPSSKSQTVVTQSFRNSHCNPVDAEKVEVSRLKTRL